MNPRMVGAIALRPVGNGQGSYYFLNVTTGRVLNRLHATAMPDDVIDKLHRMARQQKNNPGLIFADRNLSLDEYDDEEDDKTYHEEDSISDDEEEALNDDEEEDDEINGNDEEAQDPPDNEDDDVDEEEEEAQGPQAEENGAAEGPPQLENDEEADNVGLMAEAEAILPAEAEQPEDLANHEAESPEVPEIYGVNEEMNDPETPGVGVIQFPPEMDKNWVRYGIAKLGQISRLPNWQRMLFCAYTTQLLHSTGEVCWNNKDSYFIWFEFVCRNSGQIASRRSWKRSCLGLEYTSKCSRLALLWEPN